MINNKKIKFVCYNKSEIQIVNLWVIKVKKKKCFTIDEHINIAKNDIIIYLIIMTILILILLYICYRIDFYYYMYFSILGLFLIIGRIQNYIRIKRIKNYLVNNSLIRDIGNILFWNEDSYILTDKYIVVIQKENIVHFEYKDVKEIHNETKFEVKGIGSDIKKYLHIKLNDERNYKILISSINLVNIINKDITEFLLEKNKNIKVLK